MRLPFFGRNPNGFTAPRATPVRPGSTAPIAIDFGRRSVRMLQLAKLGSAYQCAAAGEIPGWVLGSPDKDTISGTQTGTTATGAPVNSEISTRLGELVTQAKFAGQLSMLTLPSEVFQCDTARLPTMPEVELQQSVLFEATERFGIDKATSILGHVCLGEPAAGQQDVLMMALPRAAVEAAVAPVVAAGLGVMHVEHAAFAALRAIVRQHNFEATDPVYAANFAMVHIEDRLATLIVVRERVPTMVRCVMGDWSPANPSLDQGVALKSDTPSENGQAQGDAAIEVEVDAEPTDTQSQASWRWCSLAEEALRCLRHLERSFNGWCPTHITVTGPASDPQVVDSMESVCGVQAEMAVPIRLIEAPAPCVQGNPWVATIGSAIAHLPALAPSGAPTAITRTGRPAPTRITPLTQAGKARVTAKGGV